MEKPEFKTVQPVVETPLSEPYAPEVGVLTAADGAKLPLRAWLPKAAVSGTDAPKAVILGVHGFNDYSNAFDMPGRWLAERGYAVYAYDQRGFGGAPHRGYWPGSLTLDQDLAEAARLLERRYPGVPLYYLGESMGAAVVMTALARDIAPAPAGTILVSPAVWSRNFMPFYQRWALWFVGHTMPWLTFTGRGLGRQASDNIEMLRAFSRDPQVIKATRSDAIKGLVDLMDQAMRSAPKLKGPILMMIGAHDQIVPPRPQWAAARALPDPVHQRVAYYKDGWHMLLRDLDGPTVWADVVTWMENHNAPLPSAADEAAEAHEAKLAKE
jgi:alpha-beta hydrolase superfamily lysophospholipase